MFVERGLHVESFEDSPLHPKKKKKKKKAGLTINVQKSKFLLKQIEYLGYVVGEGGLKPNLDNIINTICRGHLAKHTE